MTDREVAALAASMALAAAVAWSVSWWVIVAAAVAAAIWKQPLSVALVLVLLVGTLAARSERGLADVTAGPIRGWAQLVTDPESTLGGARAEVALGGRRYVAVFSDSGANAIRGLALGDVVQVSGRVSRLRGPWEWRASRHLVGRLTVRQVDGARSGALWWRVTNACRRVVTGPAQRLSPENRSLYLGIVLGDDRGQSDLLRHQFRASGLSHLLAVSGQNVAFALLVVSPIVRRVALRWRWVISIVTLVLFALMTRLEPSVLRASVMAGVAVTAAWQGRLASGIRLLSIAVIVLLVVDPLLVWSLGFRLSVAATAAVVVLASRLAGESGEAGGPFGERGPFAAGSAGQRLRLAVGVSLAAMAGTSLLLVGIAGTVPLIGPIANLVAVPLGGMLMVWGLASSAVVALLGWPLSAPWAVATDLLLDGLRSIARVAAWSWWPRVGWVGAVGVTLVFLAAAWRPAGRLRGVRSVGAACACALLVGDLWVGAGNGTVFDERGVRIWSGSAAVMVLGPTATSRTALDAVLRSRVSRLDVVLVTGGGLRTSQTVLDVRQSVDVGTVLAADPRVIRESLPLVAGPIRIGSTLVRVDLIDGRYRVRLPP